jgi:hypothetical protein
LAQISNSHYKNRFFESTPSACLQKTDFVVFSAEGAENNKIGFIMRIAKAKFILLKIIKSLDILTYDF